MLTKILQNKCFQQLEGPKSTLDPAIIMMETPKETLRCGLQTSTRSSSKIFKNILLCMNGLLLDIRLVHTYLLHRMLNFERYCILI